MKHLQASDQALNAARGSAQDAAYAWIKNYVVHQAGSEATFLTEADVTRSIGVSRTPVREALLRLEAEGLLSIMPKKGAFIPPVTDADVVAVMQARLLIEDWCIRQIGNYGLHTIAELTRVVDEQQHVTTDPLRFIELDRTFHRHIVAAGNNYVLANFHDSLRDRQIRMGVRAVGSSADRASEVLAEHRAIVEAISGRDLTRTRNALLQHLTSTLSALSMPSSGLMSMDDAYNHEHDRPQDLLHSSVGVRPVPTP
jgi:DNA-binding GntR family transcriptional regulator